MEVGQAAAVFIPDLHQIAERARRIVETGGLVDANRVEVSDSGIFFRQIAIATNDTAAVTKDADDAAVLPVGYLVTIGTLKNIKQVLRSVALLRGLFYPARRF